MATSWQTYWTIASATPAPHSNISAFKAISLMALAQIRTYSQDPYGSAPQTNFGNLPRNSFYGPHYADVDVSLYKNLYKMEKAQFKVGAQAFNVLNPTNFGAPQNDAALSNLGQINSDAVAPTSPYGSFGSPGSGRVMVVNGTLTF